MNVKGRIYSLVMNLHKCQLYLLEQHSEPFKCNIIWSAILRINTEGKSLIMKWGPQCKSNIITDQILNDSLCCSNYYN